MNEAGEPLHPVGLDHDREQQHQPDRAREQHQVADLHAGGDEQGAGGQADDDRRAEVGLGDHQDAGERDH